MSELAPLISDLALILICAGVMTLVFKRLKQPLVLLQTIPCRAGSELTSNPIRKLPYNKLSHYYTSGHILPGI